MLFGFAPWIVYWVLVGNVPFAVAADRAGFRRRRVCDRRRHRQTVASARNRGRRDVPGADDPDSRTIPTGAPCRKLIRRLRRSWGIAIVKYTPELYALTTISGATALMWVPYVIARMVTHGVMRAIGTPGAGYPIDAP